MNQQAISHRLKHARESLGLTVAQVASHVGITLPHAFDLESHDSETQSNLSLNEMLRLARLLKVPLTEIAGTSSTTTGKFHSLDELREQLQKHCAKAGLSPEEFGNQVGWELAPFIRNPESALKDWNLVCLKDICGELNLDWLHFLESQ